MSPASTTTTCSIVSWTVQVSLQESGSSRRRRLSGERMLCKKNKKRKAQADVESWLAEASAEFATGEQDLSGDAAKGPLSGAATAAVEQPLWPAALQEMGNRLFEGITSSKRESGPKLLAATVLAIRAVRLTRSLACKEHWGSVFAQLAEDRLSARLQRLRLQDGELGTDIAAYFRDITQATWFPERIRFLERLCHLDTLHFALWALARRQGLVLPHPALLHEAIGKALLGRAAVAKAVRRVLAAAPEVARSWGVRERWLSSGDGFVWNKGGCSLLRLLRSRWCEGVAAVLEARAQATEPTVRSALLQWQYSGRDAAARSLAFAIPSAEAIALLRGAAGDEGLVELGAHNGYWARTLASAGVTVSAYDISPPELASGGSPRGRSPSGGSPSGGTPQVLFGTAESLQASACRALLLCMPPPGDESCASDAIDAGY